MNILTALMDLTVLAISAGAVCGLAVTNMWTWSGMTSISSNVHPYAAQVSAMTLRHAISTFPVRTLCLYLVQKMMW